MALEDLTTYTEVDSDSVLTVTSDKVVYASLRDSYTAMVYDDKDLAHFGTTFEHDLRIKLHTEANTRFHVWALANEIADSIGYSEAVWVQEIRTDGSNESVRLDTILNSDTDDSVAFPKDTNRYLPVERTGATAIQCRVYTDEARTSLEDTISITIDNNDFRYIYALNNRDGSSGDQVNGEHGDLDLKEGAPPGNRRRRLLICGDA